jgi:nicotinamide phosphoribosyltransferase
VSIALGVADIVIAFLREDRLPLLWCKWSNSVAFGMGESLLQKVNRDTMRFAMKASAAKVNGNWRDVYKDPVTDRGKRSKKGRLVVIEPEPGNYKTIPETQLGSQRNIFETVYSDGRLIREFNFDEVRKNASR